MKSGGPVEVVDVDDEVLVLESDGVELKVVVVGLELDDELVEELGELELDVVVALELEELDGLEELVDELELLDSVNDVEDAAAFTGVGEVLVVVVEVLDRTPVDEDEVVEETELLELELLDEVDDAAACTGVNELETLLEDCEVELLDVAALDNIDEVLELRLDVLEAEVNELKTLLDVVVETLERTLDDDDEEVVEETIELLVLVTVSVYISNLLPAPQYSYWLPGQVKEQSAWLDAGIDPPLSVLPQ